MVFSGYNLRANKMNPRQWQLSTLFVLGIYRFDYISKATERNKLNAQRPRLLIPKSPALKSQGDPQGGNRGFGLVRTPKTFL